MVRLFRRRKRRIKEGMRDDKTSRLYRAACLLLAERDYEQIPVAHFAQQADMSVGAFYQRFSDKDAFLGSIIAWRLSDTRRRMAERLDLTRWRNQPAPVVTRAIVEEMIRNLHGYGAGVVRAALKRGHLDRANLEPLQHYRSALADQAVALLAKRVTLKQPERAVRAAVQMAEATALDALLHTQGPLRPGSGRMAAMLSVMMLGTLALSDAPGAPLEGKDDAAPNLADDDESDGMLDMPIEEVIAMPIPEAPPPRRRARPTAQRTELTETIPIIRPSAVAASTVEEKPEPPMRRRHRPQI